MIKGPEHSLATRKKLSDAQKGKHYSPKTEFKKGHQVNLGRKPSEEAKEKMSKSWFKKGDVPWNKGRRLPAKTRRKIGEALKGRVAWNKGKETPQSIKNKLSELAKGKHHSPNTEFRKGQHAGDKNPAKRIEVRRKISAEKMGKPHFNQRGVNHPKWRGGTTAEGERLRKTLDYKLWRKAVFARDNWTCQKCGRKGHRLNSHHSYNFADYSELRTSLKNGTTLCRECHIGFHKIYGVKNNTKEQLEQFLRVFNDSKRAEML